MRKAHLLIGIISCLLFPEIVFAKGGAGAHAVAKLPATNNTEVAQEAPSNIAVTPITPTNTTPSTDDYPDSNGDIKWSAYLDGSYNYLQRQNQFVSGVNDREFDLAPNGATLQQAAGTISVQPAEGLGGLLNILGGVDANTTAPYGLRPQTEFNNQTLAFDFPQAFLQYASGNFTFIGGRFLTLAGIEEINPTLDDDFSRSILFQAGPLTHLGIRGTYDVENRLKFIAGINDGWDNIRDFSRRKTVELGFADIVNPRFSFSAQGYNGQERATKDTDVGPIGTRTLIDLIAAYKTTEQLTLSANYDYAWQTTAALPGGVIGRARWTGIAGYLNYKFNDKWNGTLRGEVFDDRDGYITGVRQHWRELTLSAVFLPLKALELRAETRHDFSNTNSFVNKNGITLGSNQQSYALEGIYKFG